MTALSKLLGAVKIVLIARYYGISDDLDAYLVAFLVPSFAADVVAAVAGPTLIPAYMSAREQDSAAHAERLTRSFLFGSVFICAALMMSIAAFATPLVHLFGAGFAPEKIALARRMAIVMSPIILFGGLESVWRAVLNALDDFALPAAVFAITPATVMVAVLLAGSTRSGMVLAWGTFAGAAIESAATAWRLWRKGISPVPRWHGFDSHLKRAAGQYWPVFAASLILSVSAYVHQALAGTLGAGSVSALNYGNRLAAVLLAMGPSALGIAVLPHFAELAAREQWALLRTAFGHSLRTVGWIAVPVTAALIWWSAPLVRIAFQHGQFSLADTELVASVQRFYLLQVPLAIPAAVLVRLFSSIQANHVLLIAATVSLAANVGFALLFIGPMGVSGLALASSVSAVVYLVCLVAILLARKERAG